jgi:hypothetical protein
MWLKSKVTEMDLVRDKLKSFLQNHYQLELTDFKNDVNITLLLKFLVDRRNAAFGDSLVNFIYSCAKSMVRNECTGIKISDEILLSGFNQSKLHSWLKLPGKKKNQANAIESLIFFVWLKYKYSIEDMSLCLVSQMNKKDINLNDEIEEKRIAIIGFSSLFNSFNDLMRFNKLNQ